MRVLIDNYRNLTAGHCGSGAMRNLLYHYCKLELDEGVVFGLGAGLDCIFATTVGTEPPFMLFGRGSSMEVDLAENLGLDYREQTQADDDVAWKEVREEVIAGCPTMLSGDIYYLDYRQFKVHFPAHRFVLLGFDDQRQEVYIADRTEEATQTCSMRALRLSRNPPLPISTHNSWGKFDSQRVRHDLPVACELALRKTVKRMLGMDKSQREPIAVMQRGGDQICETGLQGMRALIDEMAQWHACDDAPARAQYVDNAIIKFGTGGGFFRDLFVVFMHWASMQRPDLVSSSSVSLAEQAAAGWNALSPTMQCLVQEPADRALWSGARDQLLDIYEAEYSLFGHLADSVLGAV